ncbi:hypothetical protein BJX70DRAFT_392659 [Aspergillus crustosus]
MPSTLFPTWPHIVFVILEPITLIGGWLCPLLDRPAQSWRMSMYGLLALIGIGVLNATSEPKVLRNYLIALAIADVGHIYVTYLAMGPEFFFDVRFLFVNRLLYFLGLFGYPPSHTSVRGTVEEKEKRI